MSPVPLTTVAQSPETMAELAVERMVDRIAGRKISDREIVLEPELRVRDSAAKIARENVLTLGQDLI